MIAVPIAFSVFVRVGDVAKTLIQFSPAMRASLYILTVSGALLSCSRASDVSLSALPDVRLLTLAGVPGPMLSSCPTQKCLTVLVAPWCGVCHAVAPDIVKFRRWLDTHGIASRVVVGLSDDLKQIREFASEFGSDAMIDPEGSMRARSVPYFVVSDPRGRVLKTLNGFPRSGQPEDLARYLNLLSDTQGDLR